MKRPDCFEFAMEFLGPPEDAELRVYIESLESRIAELEKALSVAVELFQDQSGDPVNEPDAYAWLQQANELMGR